jgi:anti-sigma B factor antagonist
MHAPTSTPFYTSQRLDATFATPPAGAAVVVLRLEKLTEFDTQPLTSEFDALAPKAQWRIAIDCSQLQLITSAGLGLLIQLRKKADASKGKLALFGLSPELLGLLKATKLNTLLPCAKDRASALAML